MDLSVRALPRHSISMLVRQLTSEMWTRDTLLQVLKYLEYNSALIITVLLY